METLLPYILTPVITLLLGWVLGNRKNASEIRNLELDATQKAIAIWENMARGMEKELREVNETRVKEVAELKSEITKLQIIVTDLQKENKQLKAHIESVIKK